MRKSILMILTVLLCILFPVENTIIYANTNTQEEITNASDSSDIELSDEENNNQDNNVSKDQGNDENNEQTESNEKDENTSIDENNQLMKNTNQELNELSKTNNISKTQEKTPIINREEAYALKHPVKVYEKPDSSSKVLKEYAYNKKLKYNTYTDEWHQVVVKINGVTHRGYVSTDSLGPRDNAPNVKGVALKDKTHVYSADNKRSKKLKSYSKNSILKYRAYDSNWYIATVYVNGKAQVGFISVDDVDTISSNRRTLKGIGIKKNVYVYASPTRNKNVLKTYSEGSQLKFKQFSKNWYEATVYVKGKAKTGYIAIKDVELLLNNTERLQGIGLKNKTNVYASPSRNVKALKSYHAGKLLRFERFSPTWYKATVYVKGKATIGYIHINDVDVVQTVKEAKKVKAFAVKQNVNAYSLMSKKSKVLKTYRYGHQLILREYLEDWYEATVYVNGKAQKSYFSKEDIELNENTTLNGYANKNTVSVYENQSKQSKVLRSYQKGKVLKYRPYNSKWFKATVIIKGKRKDGFISTRDVSPNNPAMYAYTLDDKTHVYASPSKSSKKLKSYKQGKRLKFTTFTPNWHRAIVYVNGKATTGYIYAKDVGEKGQKIKNLPILMYHHIGSNPPKADYGLYVSAKNFTKQMEYLRDAGYTPIHFDEIDNVNKIDKPIVVTFDDGKKNNEQIYEIFKTVKSDKFTPKATLFVITNSINKNTYLSSEQLKKFSDSGMISIQSHTVSHPFFNDKAGSYNLELELSNSKQKIENITGKPVVALAYPYGSYNDDVIIQTSKYYDYAVTTRHRVARTNDSMYELDRIRVSYDTSLNEFKKMIQK